MLYEGKVALVTGGASGIGRAAAIEFAQEGACVTVADVNRAGGEQTVLQIVATGGRAIFVETDVTSETAIAAMVQKTVSEFGGLDAAFNNAGVTGDYSTAVSCTMEEWDRIIRINMTSVWLSMKYEIPEMIKRGGGGIVNTSSRLGDSATNQMLSYTATKHAVIGLSRSAAFDFGPQNIRVNALLPGCIETPMLHAGAKGVGITVDAFAQFPPLKRLGRPEEAAALVVLLCSDRCAYVTGMPISIDGGLTACFV